MIILNKEELDYIIRKLKSNFSEEVGIRPTAKKEMYIFNAAIEKMKSELLQYEEK